MTTLYWAASDWPSIVNGTNTTPATMNGMATAWMTIDVGGRFMMSWAAWLREPELLLSLEHQPQMSSVEAKGVAYLVFQVTLIGKVYQLRVIDCEKKGGRVYANLL